jgi:hypothetical protein
MNSMVQGILIGVAIIVLIAAAGWLYFSLAYQKNRTRTARPLFSQKTPRIRRDARRKKGDQARQSRQDFLSQWGVNQLDMQVPEQKVTSSQQENELPQQEGEMITLTPPGKNGKAKKGD